MPRQRGAVRALSPRLYADLIDKVAKESGWTPPASCGTVESA